MSYPRWRFFPTHVRAPEWANGVVQGFADAESDIDSRLQSRSSDQVLRALAPGLEALGFQVERRDGGLGRIERPVLFGEQGTPRTTYSVDAVHDSWGALLEVEAGRGWMGNAVYRDLIRTSLVVDARFLILAVRETYTYRSNGRTIVNDDCRRTHDLLDAVYSSGRLALPFEGVLVIGY